MSRPLLLLSWAMLAGVLIGLREALALGVPLGSDASMWGLAARELQAGQAIGIQPVYPLLVALVSSLSGQATWWEGGLVSSLATAALPGLSVVLARRLELPWPLAIGAGLLSILLPEQLVFAFQLQPEAVTALALLGVVLAGLVLERDGRVAPLLLVCGLLVLLREHGLVISALLAVVLGLRRWPRPGLALGILGLIGGLVCIRFMPSELLPARLAVPISGMPMAAGRFDLPHYIGELARELRGPASDAWRAGEVGVFWWMVIEEMLRRHWKNLLLVLAGAGGFGLSWRRRGWGWSGLLALAPMVALILSWSHRRHSGVLLPVAVLGMATGLVCLGPWLRRVALAGACGLLGLVVADGPWLYDRLEGQAHAASSTAKLAAWMQEQEGPLMLGGLDNEINLYLGWQRNNPPMPPRCSRSAEWTGADWNTLWVGPRHLRHPAFEKLYQDGPVGVFRLYHPSSEPRPCRDVRLVPGPLYVNAEHQGLAEPSCAETVPIPPIPGCGEDEPDRHAAPSRGKHPRRTPRP